MPETTFARALTRALDECMAGDPSIILLGEDVAASGGPFKVTRGLLEKYGPARVRDTPISEAALAGAAVGAALTHLRPIVEIMFMDFTTLAMDAVVNQAAKAHFMFGGRCEVPMVLRTPHGGGLNAGPQHSQCLESWFCHVPGLKVVCPSTPADAYGLLRSSVAEPNPVVFVENKALYASKGELAEHAGPVPLGEARLAREGRDVTLVTYGAMVHVALAAAATLAREGIELEVVDLRTLQPWDEARVLESVRRTHRLVVAHEAVEAFGVGAEIAARMGEIAFDELDAPILRVGAPFMPVPFARSLEERYLPDAGRIVAAARRAMA